jgi:ACS family tartrate transporter-like MFS transporter
VRRGGAAHPALVDSCGDLSGFVAPYLIGWLADLSGSFRPGMWTVAGFMVLAGVVVLLLGRRAPDPERSPS